MSRPPRKYVPYPERLAAALACLLSQDVRDEMRRHKVPATAVLRLFEWDHIHLFSLGGSSDWWNLDPKMKAVHREKSRKDTGIAAKVKRIRERQSFLRGLDAAIDLVDAHGQQLRIGTKRKIANRGFAPNMRKWPKRPSRTAKTRPTSTGLRVISLGRSV